MKLNLSIFFMFLTFYTLKSTDIFYHSSLNPQDRKVAKICLTVKYIHVKNHEDLDKTEPEKSFEIFIDEDFTFSNIFCKIAYRVQNWNIRLSSNLAKPMSSKEWNLRTYDGTIGDYCKKRYTREIYAICEDDKKFFYVFGCDKKRYTLE